MPILIGLVVKREGLAEYCNRMGYDRSRFWFRKEKTGKWAVLRERDVEQWLREIGKERKQAPKGRYFKQAEKKFPGIPEKAFNRAWARAVPERWKRPAR
jgi:hypothetical protein